MTALPRAIRAWKGERLRSKTYSYREGDTRKQHSHDCLPTFRWVHTSVYLPEAAYEALRQVAFDERRKIHDLLMKASSWP